MLRVEYRTRSYTPSEVHELAARFRAAAERCRALAAEARATLGRLDESWAGNAKNRFSADYGNMPQRLDGLASYYTDLASQIDAMTVTVVERVEVVV